MATSVLGRIPVVGGLAYVERVRRLPSSFVATLAIEPDNRYFPHAIAVLANGEKVGYVAPEIARGYYEPLKELHRRRDVSGAQRHARGSRDVGRRAAARLHGAAGHARMRLPIVLLTCSVLAPAGASHQADQPPVSARRGLCLRRRSGPTGRRRPLRPRGRARGRRVHGPLLADRGQPRVQRVDRSHPRSARRGRLRARRRRRRLRRFASTSFQTPAAGGITASAPWRSTTAASRRSCPGSAIASRWRSIRSRRRPGLRASLVDVGAGATESDYAGKDDQGRGRARRRAARHGSGRRRSGNAAPPASSPPTSRATSALPIRRRCPTNSVTSSSGEACRTTRLSRGSASRPRGARPTGCGAS